MVEICGHLENSLILHVIARTASYGKKKIYISFWFDDVFNKELKYINSTEYKHIGTFLDL